MTTPAQIARFAGRLALLGVTSCVVAVVAMQFEGIVAKNLALGRDVAASRADVERLTERTRAQRETIRRLNEPRGAVPEIHEKLRLVGPHEEIIYIRGSDAPSPQPDDWAGGR